jgi:predicted metalloprotease with PDZ domain
LSAVKVSWRYGFKTILKNDKLVVVSVLEKSSAFISDLAKNDKIISVNGFVLNNDLEDWMSYFNDDKLVLQIERDQKLKNVELVKSNTFQFYNYDVKEI